MIETIAAAIFGGSVVFTVIYLLGRIEYWKGSYNESVRELEEAIDRISGLDREVKAQEDKHEAVMTVFRQMGDRPVVAALSDKHIEQIVTSLATIAAQSRALDRLN